MFPRVLLIWTNCYRPARYKSVPAIRPFSWGFGKNFSLHTHMHTLTHTLMAEKVCVESRAKLREARSQSNVPTARGQRWQPWSGAEGQQALDHRSGSPWDWQCSVREPHTHRETRSQCQYWTTETGSPGWKVICNMYETSNFLSASITFLTQFTFYVLNYVITSVYLKTKMTAENCRLTSILWFRCITFIIYLFWSKLRYLSPWITSSSHVSALLCRCVE